MKRCSGMFLYTLGAVIARSSSQNLHSPFGGKRAFKIRQRSTARISGGQIPPRRCSRVIAARQGQLCRWLSARTPLRCGRSSAGRRLLHLICAAPRFPRLAHRCSAVGRAHRRTGTREAEGDKCREEGGICEVKEGHAAFLSVKLRNFRAELHAVQRACQTTTPSPPKTGSFFGSGTPAMRATARSCSAGSPRQMS